MDGKESHNPIMCGGGKGGALAAISPALARCNKTDKRWKNWRIVVSFGEGEREAARFAMALRWSIASESHPPSVSTTNGMKKEKGNRWRLDERQMAAVHDVTVTQDFNNFQNRGALSKNQRGMIFYSSFVGISGNWARGWVWTKLPQEKQENSRIRHVAWW